MTQPAVDILIPGTGDVVACLDSVRGAQNTTAAEVIVVGRDTRITETPGVTVIEQDWPDARDHVMGLHPDRDVVLLSPATRVFGDWLDRLRQAAGADEDVRSASPLFNGSPAASYPLAGDEHARRLEVDCAGLDALAAEVNRGLTVPVDSVPQDCLYLRRAVPVGKHVVAADVVVRRGGFVDPPPSTVAPNAPAHAPRRLEFSAPDPLASARRALDLARLDLHLGSMARFLFITHSWGGGTERQIQHLRTRLEQEGVAVFVARPDPAEGSKVLLETPLNTPNLPPVRIDSLAGALADLRISRVQIHNLAGYRPDSARTLAHGLADAGIPYELSVHDCQAMCPRITMIGLAGTYCGEPAEPICQRCVDHLGSPFGQVSVARWRTDFAELLAGAQAVSAPSHDSAARVERYFPSIDVEVRPHPDPMPTDSYPDPPARENRRYRIGILGKVGPPKGPRMIQQVAEECAREYPDLEFRLIGSFDRRLRIPPMDNLHITGPYEDEHLMALMAEQELDIVWFPSIVPESFSHTLSVALRTPLPIVAFDLGAIAERLRAAGRGSLLGLDLLLDPAGVARELRRVCAQGLEQPTEPPPIPASVLRDYYNLG